jgi:peptidoglycan/xylan/chitin deacetylase (PgdA/CDA1 family)
MKPARAIPVLMYHHVSPAPGLVTVTPETFRAQMSHLARNGWRGIGCDDLGGFLAGRSLPARSFLITFDDGYLDNYVHAYPVLREFGMRATIFAVTGWMGDGPARASAADGGATPACPDHSACKQAIARGAADDVMLRWSEIERMRADGACEFHSHTHSHRRWDREIADGVERESCLAADLVQSRETLRGRLGVDSRHLCWPQGHFDDAYLRTARAAGFTYCYTTQKGVNRAGSDPLRIGRIVAKEASPQWLEHRLSWFSSPLIGGLYTRLRGD